MLKGPENRMQEKCLSNGCWKDLRTGCKINVWATDVERTWEQGAKMFEQRMLKGPEIRMQKNVWATDVERTWEQDAREMSEQRMLKGPENRMQDKCLSNECWKDLRTGCKNVWATDVERTWEQDAKKVWATNIERTWEQDVRKIFKQRKLKGPENRVQRICLKKDSEENIWNVVLRKCMRKIYRGNFLNKRKKCWWLKKNTH